VAALAFEAQHRIDHMLEHARTGDRPVLGDVADEDHGSAMLLGEADQLLRARADLADRARRALDQVAVHRLDRIDDQQRRRLGLANGGYFDNANASSTFVPTSWQIAGIGDINGDGRDDLVWRNSDGRTTNWLGLANGGYSDNATNSSTSVPLSWHIDGIGDFNGDGRDDILWRNDDGRTTNWLGLANGGYFDNANNSMTFVPLSWQVAQVGDYNGDGRDDILWRNNDGRITDWLGLANGGYFDNAGASSTFVPLSWQIAGIGDINGDGRDDIIWRRDDGAFTTWLSQPNGSFVSNDTNSWALVPTNWKVEGTGDFNGDGADDIVWRRDDGAFTTWLSTGNGSFVSNDANSWAVIPTTWQVVETGDYNGDGRDDILWRRSDGGFTNWLSTGNGSFVSNDLNAFTVIPNAWHVQGSDTYWPS